MNSRYEEIVKFYVNWLRGFSAVAPPKVPFPILIRTSLTTVLHYRADCDFFEPRNCQQVGLGTTSSMVTPPPDAQLRGGLMANSLPEKCI